MRRCPPRTIHRYLDLPSTQRIQIHNSHRHNTTPPLQTPIQAPYPLPTYTTHTTATKTQTHLQHFPCSHRIGKSQTQSSHPLTPLSTQAAPSQTHTHLTHSTKLHPTPPNSTQLHPTPPNSTQLHPTPPNSTQLHPNSTQLHPTPPNSTQLHPTPPNSTQIQIQNAALRTATGWTQDTNIQHLHDETLILPIHEYLQLHASQYKQKTQHPSHPLHKHTTYFNPPRQKNTLFNNGLYQTNITTDPHTVTTTNIKTNKRHIHTSIVSMHLATRGINKILRTPPTHNISSEERLPGLTRLTLAQLGTNKSPCLKSYLHKVDTKSHPSPLFPLCNTHTHDTRHLFSCTHIAPHCHPWICWQTPLEWWSCWPDGEISWLVDQSGMIGLPPQTRVKEVGRQQQQVEFGGSEIDEVE